MTSSVLVALRGRCVQRPSKRQRPQRLLVVGGCLRERTRPRASMSDLSRGQWLPEGERPRRSLTRSMAPRGRARMTSEVTRGASGLLESPLLAAHTSSSAAILQLEFTLVEPSFFDPRTVLLPTLECFATFVCELVHYQTTGLSNKISTGEHELASGPELIQERLLRKDLRSSPVSRKKEVPEEEGDLYEDDDDPISPSFALYKNGRPLRSPVHPSPLFPHISATWAAGDPGGRGSYHGPPDRPLLHDSGRGIITADNTVHKIQKEGAIVIDNNPGESITLKSVYHVPRIQKNLFSVANAVDDGNFVLFGPRDVKFLRNVKEIKADVVHTGTRVDDLFVLSASNSYIENMSSNDNSSLWNARLGHLNMTKLKFGKADRLPFESSNSRCTIPLERIHSDLMGPTRTDFYSGSHYMLLFVDDYTRFTWVYFVKHKLEVFSRFLEFKETVEEELCRKIKILWTDNGGEFCSNEFFSFGRNNGIKREMSCPKTPQQNGLAERKIRHFVETCKCWLHAKNLSKELWAEGMKCAAYVINRVPLSPTNNKAPYELLFDVKPNVKYFRVFSSICYVHVSESQRSKLDAKAIKSVCKEENDTITLPSSHSSKNVFEENQGERKNLRSIQNDGSQEETNNQRPRRNIVRLSHYKDDNFVTNFYCFFANPIDDDEPSSYVEAKGVKEWEAAMKEEMDALQKNQTWDLVLKPTEVQPVSCKWVFRIKRKDDGSIDRFKARLVARASEADSSLFIKKRQGLIVIILLYMDDIILTGSNYAEFNYAKRLIEKFGLIDGKKWSTPLDVSARLRRDEGTCLSDPRPFRALMGSLIYLTIIRPDIAFSVGMGVEFSLQGFVDADFGGDLDDQRSTSGFVFV
ncbi:hypothetical protein ZIOFF_053942 [Zingiber officinale]|uniref:Integrase catalytic domain-containing protein n=1 Tax=Zingiber officinale TaxID=94328 RepID=A0A8J5KQN3_ZINOF|nr:hypothetical protein ZIOFF_053942 [Zingiber officinale]